MKHLKHLVFALGLMFASLVVAPTAALATCGDGASSCYVVGTGNFSATTVVWAATSGGAAGCGGTCAPATGDSIVFDANSNGKTVTITASASINNFTSSCTATCTLVQNASTILTVMGTTFTFGSNLVFSPISSNQSTIAFTSTSTVTITTNGQSYCSLTFNGAGGTYTLVGNIQTIPTFNSCVMNLTQGTLDAATNNVNVSLDTFLSTGTATRVLNMGSGTWTVNSASTSWSSSGTGFTLNASTSTISIPSTWLTQNTGRNFSDVATTPSHTYYNINIPAISPSTSVSASVSFTGTWSANSITVGKGVQLAFGQSSVITLATCPAWAGTAFTAGNFMTISGSSTLNVIATVSVASGTCNAMAYAVFTNIRFNGGATFSASSSYDFGNNSGISISPPSGGGTTITGILGSGVL